MNYTRINEVDDNVRTELCIIWNTLGHYPKWITATSACDTTHCAIICPILSTLCSLWRWWQRDVFGEQCASTFWVGLRVLPYTISLSIYRASRVLVVERARKRESWWQRAVRRYIGVLAAQLKKKDGYIYLTTSSPGAHSQTSPLLLSSSNFFWAQVMIATLLVVSVVPLSGEASKKSARSGTLVSNKTCHGECLRRGCCFHQIFHQSISSSALWTDTKHIMCRTVPWSMCHMTHVSHDPCVRRRAGEDLVQSLNLPTVREKGGKSVYHREPCVLCVVTTRQQSTQQHLNCWLKLIAELDYYEWENRTSIDDVTQFIPELFPAGELQSSQARCT